MKKAAQLQWLDGDDMGKKLDVSIGEVYGKLTVIAPVESGKGGRRWLCECECGGEKIVVSSNLVNGKTRSCGCLAAENISKAHEARGKRTVNSGYKQTLCWDCIRSAAPPSLQCIRDQTKGQALPEGAKAEMIIRMGNYNTDINTAIVLSCPEFLSVYDQNNIELLQEERRKIQMSAIKEVEESGLNSSGLAHDRSTNGWWKVR